MAEATNEQVQVFADTRIRPGCEQIRNLYLKLKDDQAVFDDIYGNISTDPDWVDSRPDAPPHLMTPNDMLAWNTFASRFVEFIEGTLTDVTMNEAASQFPVILDCCVRGPVS